MASEEFDDFKIQFYSVTGLFGFLFLVLFSLIIELFVKVKRLKKNVSEKENEQTSISELSEITLPKPKYFRNWHEESSNIRPKIETNEFISHKPTNWKMHASEENKNPKRNDYRNHLMNSNYLNSSDRQNSNYFNQNKRNDNYGPGRDIYY